MTKHDISYAPQTHTAGLQDTEMVSIGALVPNRSNARTHNSRQIRKIAASIERFGFVNPILIDADGGIIAGDGRVEAAKQLGLTSVPTLRVEHLSDADKRAYILADNRLAEDAGWDEEMLAIELQGLIDLDVSIELTGFELSEVDQIIERQGRGQTSSEDPTDALLPVETDIPAVTQPGDLWELGSHRLLCGDPTTTAP